MNKNRKGLMALEGLDAALPEDQNQPDPETTASTEATPGAADPVAQVVDPAAPGASTPADVAVDGGPAEVTGAELDPAAVEAAVDPSAAEVPPALDASGTPADPVVDPAVAEDPAVNLQAVEAPADPIAEGEAAAAADAAAEATRTEQAPALDAAIDAPPAEGTPAAADTAAPDLTPVQSAIDETVGATEPATGPGEPLQDPTTDPVADPATDPAAVATDPAVDPAAAPAAAAEPAVDPAAEPAATDASADPVVPPAQDPAASTDPLTDPVTDPATPAADGATDTGEPVTGEDEALPYDENVPGDVVETDEEVLDIDQQLDNLTEGEIISDGVDAVGAKLEASVERGEGLSEEDASLANIVLEGYYNRLSYVRPNRTPSISLEGISDAERRLANSKMALEELKVFRKKLDVSLAYANEGLLDSISAHLGNASAKIRVAGEQLLAWSAKYDKSGPVTGPIKGGRWAQALGGFRTELVKPAEVAARVKEIERALIQGQPTKVVRDLTVYAKAVAAELGKGKSQAVAQDGLERKIENFREAAHNVRETLSTQAGRPAVASNFEPLDKNTKAQLVHSAQNIAHELLALSEAWEGFRAAVGEIRRAADKAEKSQTTSKSSGGVATSGRTIGLLIGGVLGAVSGGVAVAGAVVGFSIGGVVDFLRSGPVKWTKTEQSAYKNQAGDVKAEAKDTLRSLVELDGNTLRAVHGVIAYLAKSTA